MNETPKKLVFSLLISLTMGCTTVPPLPDRWSHEPHAEGVHPDASWKMYSDESLLSGRHTHTLCGTSDAAETNGARFCFRRSRNQLVLYVVPSHEKVATARMEVGLLTHVRVDSNRPVSPRSAFGEPWGRGFAPRFPNASFPIDGTNPRTGEIEPGGFFDQLVEGETLSARVPLEPDRYGVYAIHLDGLPPLLHELWEHKH